jgi:hypothetical protein
MISSCTLISRRREYLVLLAFTSSPISLLTNIEVSVFFIIVLHSIRVYTTNYVVFLFMVRRIYTNIHIIIITIIIIIKTNDKTCSEV